MLGRSVSLNTRPNPLTEYVPSRTSVSEKEIVMVYIGASTCGFANDPDLPEIIENIKLLLQQKANTQGFGFSVIGVSIDWDVKKGVQHLDKFGTFDEILTGREWHGYGGRHFFWESMPSSIFGTPQVLLIAKKAEHSNLSLLEQEFPPLSETLLVRKIGIKQITEWFEQGLSFPRDW